MQIGTRIINFRCNLAASIQNMYRGILIDKESVLLIQVSSCIDCLKLIRNVSVFNRPTALLFEVKFKCYHLFVKKFSK